MKWPSKQIKVICERTRTSDPRKRPGQVFTYVDIASIDRDQKTITQVSNIRGADAPSRARKEIRAGDILVSTVRPNLNAAAIVPPELNGQIASTGFCVLRPDTRLLDGRYLFYFARTQGFIDTLISKVRGAHYPAVSDDDVKSIEIPLPSITEQRRIVEILDQADALRKQRAEADAKAARILPVLFHRMFGDQATNSKDWLIERLNRFFDVVGGGTPPKSNPNYWQGDIPWVSPKDIKSEVITDTEDHITEEAIRNSATRLIKKGSVLVVFRSGILAHTFPIAIAGRDLAINQDMKALNSKGELLNEYLYGWLVSSTSRVLSCVKKGATVHNIDGSRFLSLQLAKPPKELQQRFAKRLNNLLEHKNDRSVVGQQIELLFNVLLHRAFTGNLTATWREAHTKELLQEMEHQAKTLSTGIDIAKLCDIAESRKESDLQLPSPAFLKIQEEVERLNRLVNPSYLSVYEQINRALEPISKHHMELIRPVEISGIASSHIGEILRATQHWQDLIDQTTISRRVFRDITETHHSWLNKINPMQDSIEQLQAATRFSLGDIAYRMTVTERLFAEIEFEAMRKAIMLPEPDSLKLESVIGDIASTYERLAASIASLPDLTHLPTFVMSGATREVFTTGYAIDSICAPDKTDSERDESEVHLIFEAEQEVSGCIGLLKTIEPALVRPYIGARDALRGSSADRTRHVLVSLRELWNHLLRRLAPDNDVLGWLPNDSSDLLHKGKPTRKARVLYVCRYVNSPPLSEFVVKDTNALVQLMQLFHRVHELESGLTDQQIKTIMLKTESWLMYLLNIWQENK